jgi:hypothetical protein
MTAIYYKLVNFAKSLLHERQKMQHVGANAANCSKRNAVNAETNGNFPSTFTQLQDPKCRYLEGRERRFTAQQDEAKSQ